MRNPVIILKLTLKTAFCVQKTRVMIPCVAFSLKHTINENNFLKTQDHITKSKYIESV